MKNELIRGEFIGLEGDVDFYAAAQPDSIRVANWYVAMSQHASAAPPPDHYFSETPAKMPDVLHLASNNKMVMASN